MNVTQLKPHKSPRPHKKIRRKHRKAKKRTVRQPVPPQPLIDSFRAQHLALAQRQIITELGRTSVIVDETESPLVWLSRRRVFSPPSWGWPTGRPQASTPTRWRSHWRGRSLGHGRRSSSAGI